MALLCDFRLNALPARNVCLTFQKFTSQVMRSQRVFYIRGRKRPVRDSLAAPLASSSVLRFQRGICVDTRALHELAVS